MSDLFNQGNLRWRFDFNWWHIRSTSDNGMSFTIHRTLTVDKHLGCCYVTMHDDDYTPNNNRVYFDDVFKAIKYCEDMQ